MASLVPEGLCDVHNTMQVRPRVGQNNVNDISLDNDRGATVEVWSVWSVRARVCGVGVRVCVECVCVCLCI